VSSFDIEVKWGGEWKRPARRYASGFVDPALSLVRDFALEQGLLPELPKVAKIWRIPGTFPSSGESLDATNFDLHVLLKDVRYKRLEQYFPDMALTAIHEFLHCLRSESHTEQDVIEISASEGIAHVGEEMLARELLGPWEYDSYDSILPDMNDAKLAAFTDAMYVDRTEQTPFLEVDPGKLDPIHLKWLGGNSRERCLAPGVVIGMHHVQRHLDQGVPFPELVHWPADEIIAA